MAPLAVLAVLALTVAASVLLDGARRQADAARHARLNERLQGEIQQRVAASGRSLGVLRTVFSASDEVTADAFERAVASQRLETEHPGITRLGWAEAVPRAEVPSYVEAVRAGGTPGFGMNPAHPAGVGDTAMIVRLAAPRVGAEQIIGLDLSGEKVRRTAALRAARRRALTATPAVELRTGDGDGHPAFLLMLPLHADAEAPRPDGSGGGDLRGWIVAALRIGPFFEGLAEDFSEELDYAVLETAAAGGHRAIYEAGLGAGAAAGTAVDAGGVTRHDMELAGHRWTLATRRGSGFAAASVAPVWTTAGVGSTLTLLLALLFRSQRRMLDTARRLATRMTRDLRVAANTDRLTGLPNRTRIVARIGDALERERRGGPSPRRFAVLFLDFDRFKLVNDQMGHDAGDELLRQIGQRLRQGVRPGDAAGSGRHGRPDARERGPRTRTAARLGGDEFVVLLEDLATERDAVAIAQRLLDTLAEPYQIGGSRVESTASIGLAMSDPTHRDVAEVLREADTAMYEAKREAPGTCRVFDAQLRGVERRRLQLLAGIAGAGERGELRLQYQPIVRDCGRVESLEALVRWQHPELGLVPPDEFIPLAESSGEIVPMGAWILCAAVEAFAGWRSRPGFPQNASVSVNLSRRQLADPTLCSVVAGCLDRHRVPPSLLHLEVTEREVMEDPEVALSTLRVLRAAGVTIDLDDFGTGHSSLACLHQFPLDVLKIDRAFVAGLGVDPTRTAVFRGVLDLARTLDLRVIAEGIETPQQRAIVTGLGCELLQGFGLSRPLDPEAAAAFCLAAGGTQLKLAA